VVSVFYVVVVDVSIPEVDPVFKTDPLTARIKIGALKMVLRMGSTSKSG
jgi:hypothetical protein